MLQCLRVQWENLYNLYWLKKKKREREGEEKVFPVDHKVVCLITDLWLWQVTFFLILGPDEDLYSYPVVTVLLGYKVL